ncbi:dimethylaniline monooxygenase [N-oxide-forming] 1-like [Vombatus ursinus]|uniref:dimethylaniline monooxygenase [N-oxide-forming] 1-like n=1 Tax=Vombatus ursinus TaxID=29139 RepID=UPI000FFD049E|nr:dimethylaniline monooxygenase [N-oxide-forming] 1-like [Vombatus ursinus]
MKGPLQKAKDVPCKPSKPWLGLILLSVVVFSSKKRCSRYCAYGIKTFKGQYFHSREYKHPDLFKDKRVLVIGMGNSGTDIAVEASHVAKKVLLSTTGGAWMINLVFDRGYPWDMVFTSRFQSALRNSLPTSVVNWLIGKKANSWFDHANYGLVPENRTFLREPVLNSELPGCIITGKVLIKPSVETVKDNSVVFKNTPEEEPVDIIVFATGYTFAFPFLDESIVKVENNQASLYKYVFPAHLEKPTLAQKQHHYNFRQQVTSSIMADARKHHVQIRQ